MVSLPGRLAGYHAIYRRWPQVSRKATAWLMPLELLGLVPCLVIFGLSQPDLYRTKFWEIGFENQLNSNPNMIVFAMVNHKPLPHVPLVWSRTLTNFNVAISVVSLFFLLAKLIAFIMRVWLPIIAVFINIAIAALYTVSVYGQIGPDFADPRYPSPVVWYIRQGCGLAERYRMGSSCKIAQSSLGITVYMLSLYLLNLGFAIYAMWPNKLDHSNGDENDDDNASSAGSEPKDMYNYEMQGMKTPMSARTMPYTPRTQAFHTLDRTMPSSTGRRYG